jgi:hypothetical protein
MTLPKAEGAGRVRPAANGGAGIRALYPVVQRVATAPAFCRVSYTVTARLIRWSAEGVGLVALLTASAMSRPERGK